MTAMQSNFTFVVEITFEQATHILIWIYVHNVHVLSSYCVLFTHTFAVGTFEKDSLNECFRKSIKSRLMSQINRLWKLDNFRKKIG